MLTDTISPFPTDPALGGPLDWLEPAVVMEAVREHVDTQSGDSWQDCRLIEALYHPGRYVRAAYVLVHDADTPAARAWPEGQIVYLHAPARHPVSRRGTLIRIGGVEAELYRFPNDRRLRGLRKFTGRQDAARTWQNWIDSSDGQFRIDEESLQRLLVRYVPEQKWVVRLRADATSGDNGRPGKRRIAVRSAAPSVCHALADRHTALAQAASAQDGVFQVPAVVGLDARLGLLAVEWIRGDRLTDVLQTDDPSSVMQRAARILASVHRSKVPGLPALTTSDVIRRINESAEDLAATCPHHADRWTGVADELTGRLESVDTTPAVTLHNDFHWNQLSIKRERWALLDLERMCRGDALIDVANLATQLRMLALRPEIGVDSETAALWSRAFLEQWTQITGTEIDPVRFSCYAALSILELVRGMMRHLRLGWQVLAEHCIEMAEAHVGGPLTEGRHS